MRKLFIISFLLIFVQSAAFAYDFMEDGIAYNILKDGTLSVTHKQDKASLDFEPDSAYKGNVVIPASVVHKGKKYLVSEIGENAFFGSKNMLSLIIPEGIKRIKKKALSYLNITSLAIPASVVELTPGFEFKCPKLAKITVSPRNGNYKSLDNCIYNKDMTQLILVATAIKVYKFPASVKSVVDYAFNCSTLKRLVIPDTLEYIGGESFFMSDIKNIICKKKLKRLPGSARYNKQFELPLWAELG